MGEGIKKNWQDRLKIYARITDAMEVMQKAIVGFKGVANGRIMIFNLGTDQSMIGTSTKEDDQKGGQARLKF
jgi:hypothetical protein